MKVAVSTWNGRISPVFDASRQMVVLEVDGGKIVGRHEEPLDEDLGRKVEQLVGAGIQVLVCGAISQPLAWMLVTRGLRVLPFIAGGVDEVTRAYLAGELDRPRFAMPGCCGRRMRFGGGRGGHGCRRGPGGW